MNLNRRALLKNGLGMLVAAPVGLAAWNAFAKEVAKTTPASAPALKLVDPATDQLAKVLGYVHDAKAAPAAAHKEDFGGKKHPAASQKCGNCMLYAKTGTLDGGEVGKCTMIASGMVKVGGWCKSWSPKA